MAPARRSIPCEVDYRNHGETVLVLPDLKKTTVTLSQPHKGSSDEPAPWNQRHQPQAATSGVEAPVAGGGNHAAGGGSWLVDSERRMEEVR
jgi:hypothetical protein